MYTVYILRSIKYPDRYYTGLTQNLDERLKEHNSGISQYSKNYAPWKVETHITFRNKSLANDFEKYLKKGSGYAFMRKRFIGVN